MSRAADGGHHRKTDAQPNEIIKYAKQIHRAEAHSGFNPPEELHE